MQAERCTTGREPIEPFHATCWEFLGALLEKSCFHITNLSRGSEVKSPDGKLDIGPSEFLGSTWQSPVIYAAYAVVTQAEGHTC